MAPAMLLALIATILVQATFAKYSRRMVSSQMTGAAAARRLLDAEGLRAVEVEQVDGFLSDHYDPRSRRLRLSAKVYGSPSLSAIGVACHEAGHAIQHARAYAPLTLRTALVPITQIGTYASWILIPIGFMLGSLGLVKIGIFLFLFVVLFSLVTLPVEWDASRRAKRMMVTSGIVTNIEAEDAGKVLNAAFLTYLAALITALMHLLYYLLQSGLLGGRRSD
jgi:Zn-dependent membrane protease YugP